MEVFVLDYDARNGRVIRDFTSITWSEKYGECGDFVLEAPLHSDTARKIMQSRFISMTKSDQLMTIDDVLVSRKKGSPPTIRVSGLSFEAITKHRIVTPTSAGLRDISDDTPVEYEPGHVTFSVYSQVKFLLEDFIENYVLDPMDVIPDARVVNLGVSWLALGRTVPKRQVKRGILYDRVYDILNEVGVVLSSRRPFRGLEDSGTPGYAASYGPYHKIGPYLGRDLRDTVTISIGVSGAYSKLKTTREYKSAVFVCAKYESIMVIDTHDPDGVPIDPLTRKWVYAEAADIDGFASDPDVLDELNTRALNAMAGKKVVNTLNVTVDTDTLLRFNDDFRVGDIVTVVGEFGRAPMRVDEFTIVIDDSGVKGIPSVVSI